MINVKYGTRDSGKYRVILIQLVRYFMVSLVAAIADFGIFLICYDGFGIGYILSNTFAFAVGVCVNYSLSIRYVFVKESSYTINEFVIFTLIGIAGYGISQLTLFVLIDLINVRAVLESIASQLVKYEGAFSKICAIGTTFTWNFVIRKIVLFNKNVKK